MLSSLSSRLEELRTQGYTCNFQVEDGKLVSPDKSGLKVDPKHVQVKEIFRFEGDTNPGDLSILYALETKEGEKGVLVDGYGAYNAEDVAKFITKVPS